jgi:5-formyltetrahydrofolate cyclo-ligase
LGGLTKQLFRKQLLHYRQLLAEDVYQVRNDQLLERIGLLISTLNISQLHLFLRIRKNKEPDLYPALLPYLPADYKLFVPVTNFETKVLTHHRLLPDTQIKESDRGIPEPVRVGNVKPSLMDIAALEMILIPLLIFDHAGERLGYGGGYYDRFLSDVPSTVHKVGLSLSGGVDELVVSEPHDIKLDWIVTPYETIKT